MAPARSDVDAVVSGVAKAAFDDVDGPEPPGAEIDEALEVGLSMSSSVEVESVPYWPLPTVEVAYADDV